MLPSVEAASVGGQLPLRSGVDRTVLNNVAGQDIPLTRRRGIAFSAVTTQYFQTLGIPMKQGRDFTDRDTNSSQQVVIINEAAARQYFPKRNALGQQIEPMMWNGAGSTTQPRTIVGIVADVKLDDLRDSPMPVVYWPFAQVPSDQNVFVAVRTSGDPFALLHAIREQLREMDKDLPLYAVETLEQSVSELLGRPRHETVLVALFAGSGSHPDSSWTVRSYRVFSSPAHA